jgi:hypothetical protein
LNADTAFCASGAVALGQAHGRHVHQRLRLLVLHEHVHHAVLQHLKLADRLAELLAGLAVLHGRLVEHLHGADRFRAHRQNALVDHLLEHRVTRTRFAKQRIPATRTFSNVISAARSASTVG